MNNNLTLPGESSDYLYVCTPCDGTAVLKCVALGVYVYILIDSAVKWLTRTVKLQLSYFDCNMTLKFPFACSITFYFHANIRETFERSTFGL